MWYECFYFIKGSEYFLHYGLYIWHASYPLHEPCKTNIKRCIHTIFWIIDLTVTRLCIQTFKKFLLFPHFSVQRSNSKLCVLWWDRCYNLNVLLTVCFLSSGMHPICFITVQCWNVNMQESKTLQHALDNWWQTVYKQIK